MPSYHRGMSSPNDPEAESSSVSEKEARQERAIAEYRRKLDYVNASYHRAREVEATYPSFNESLKLLAKGTNPRARRLPEPRRPHPEVELLVNETWRARQRAAGLDPDGRPPTQPEIFDICEELAATLEPQSGRPADRVLTQHVQGLMALLEGNGSAVRAAKTRNGEYDPHMTSSGGNIIKVLFGWIDPAVTITALANIVLHARRSGETQGKSFHDYFPAYGWTVDPETGMPNPPPGQRLESFRPTPPIYCS